MASVEWNAKKKETTIWVGAGVSDMASAVSGVKAGFKGKAGMAFTFGGQSGGLVDVTLTSEVSAQLKAGGYGFEGTFATGMSAESGPSVTARAQVGNTTYGGTYTTH